MNKKSLVLLLTFIVIVLSSSIYMYQTNKRDPNKEQIMTNRTNLLQTEQFLIDHLMTKDHMIQTNFTRQRDGKLFLSESNGLWLQYLTITGDSKAFDLSYQATKSKLQLDNHLFAWRIKDGKKASTNALIDDLRIIEALYKEGERTENKKWEKEATRISKSLLKYHFQNDIIIDFYDEKVNQSNNSLTISYLNMTPFYYMEKHGLITNDVVKRMESFLSNLPKENGFYPKTYDIKLDNYIFEEQINMIDQLYIAFYLERVNIETNDFYKWFKDTYDLTNKIYGRYNKSTKEHAVDYESAAVYALSILYVLEKKDESFALSLWDKLKKMQNNERESEYYGGYIFENSTHSFDNLLALIAERKLKNEGIIP